MSFSERLDSTMEERSVSQTALGLALGVAQSTVHRWVSGSMPPARAIDQICLQLNVAPSWLVSGEGDRELTDATREALSENQKAYAFSRRLGAAVIHSRLKLRRVAAAAGISPTYVSDLIAAKKTAPSADTVFRLARSTGVTNEWLASGQGEMIGEAIAPAGVADAGEPLVITIPAGVQKVVIVSRHQITVEVRA